MNYIGEPTVCWECDPNRWDSSFVFAPIMSIYCSKCNKYMDPLDQPRKPLPILEIMPGSLPFSAKEALKALGYEDPEELRRLREQEGKDPLLYRDGPGEYKDGT